MYIILNKSNLTSLTLPLHTEMFLSSNRMWPQDGDKHHSKDTRTGASPRFLVLWADDFYEFRMF